MACESCAIMLCPSSCMLACDSQPIMHIPGLLPFKCHVFVIMSLHPHCVLFLPMYARQHADGSALAFTGSTQPAIDNPDQRICDDVGSFVRSSVSITLSLCKKIFNCVAFAGEFPNCAEEVGFGIGALYCMHVSFVAWGIDAQVQKSQQYRKQWLLSKHAVIQGSMSTVHIVF